MRLLTRFNASTSASASDNPGHNAGYNGNHTASRTANHRVRCKASKIGNAGDWGKQLLLIDPNPAS